MKIEDKSKGFQPIVITIETQEEADVLAAAIGGLSGDDSNGTLFKFYRALNRDDREYEGIGSLAVRKKLEKF